MKARMTAEMVAALKQTAELPEDLAAALNAAQPQGDAFLVGLSEDEAMELVEMCQWYIKRDPATGELGEKANLFDSIVAAIDDAQFD
ncbi:MAG: hypothetical protein JSW51_01155 [Gemmatimonadota bacterium]|nr:MAG: hypothetical protein JSW51_01155 [Gemmatimonadota bacterium]